MEAEYLPQRKAHREEKERIRKAEVVAELARKTKLAQERNKQDYIFYAIFFGILFLPVLVLSIGVRR